MSDPGRARVLVADDEPTIRFVLRETLEEEGFEVEEVADGDAALNVAIRTLRRKGDSYFTRSGAGIVWGSVPEKEFQETEHKSKAVRAAVAAASAKEVSK